MIFLKWGLWHRHFGLILDILDLMPRWLTAIITAGVDVLDFFTDIRMRDEKYSGRGPQDE